jgi:hypothetical protein
MKSVALIAALALALSACATAPKDFYANPSKPKDTALCRAVIETKDTKFQADAAAELNRRGLTAEKCQNMVAMETTAIVGITALAAGVAVVAACTNGCPGGGYTPPRYNDVDCAGGKGDGPYWQYGPIYVGGYDPNGLDADGDGVGCEASDVGYGA